MTFLFRSQLQLPSSVGKLQNMIHPRRSSENTMLPDDIDDENVIARNVDAMRNLSTSIRCQEDEAISTSKNYFGDVNVRLFVLQGDV